MDIKAYKMDSLGNDFVIIDQRKKIITLSGEQIVKICDRNFIGWQSQTGKPCVSLGCIATPQRDIFH